MTEPIPAYNSRTGRRRLSIRNIKQGEPVPDGPPSCRTITTNGYVSLFWSVGYYQQVRIYEHRAVMGNPIGQIHHKNGNKQDNRPENLEVVTQLEHSERHASWNMGEARRLYESGLSYRDIAAIIGVLPGVIRKSLRRRGFRSRSMSEAVRISWETKRS